jgi:[ribosomal protein S5]-alanine N-acetyltransferase
MEKPVAAIKKTWNVMVETITTERLILLPCTLEMLRSAIESNRTLSDFLGVIVQDHWTEFGIQPLSYVRDKLLSDPNQLGWWTYFVIHKEDNKLIGTGGYQGLPDQNGMVEIGYEIAAEYRDKGLATEFAAALVRNAFESNLVRKVQAHTLAESNASSHVLIKCGFIKVDEVSDPKEGNLWRWEIIPLKN